MKICVLAIINSEDCVTKQLFVSRSRGVNTFRDKTHAGHDPSRKQSSSCLPNTQLILILLRYPPIGCFQERFRIKIM